jgi:crossover junction endodeoxyribonuclease RuvC
MRNKAIRVLGIDPGYERIGIAVVEKNSNGSEQLLYSDCIVTNKKQTHPKRLLVIGIELENIIRKFKPDVCAVEKLFFNENQKTALAVAEARGVILFTASQHNLSVFEYTPLEIKVAVTGYGRADKKQMIFMTEKLIAISKKIQHDDEYDAIAAALTCIARERVF